MAESTIRLPKVTNGNRYSCFVITGGNLKSDWHTTDTITAICERHYPTASQIAVKVEGRRFYAAMDFQKQANPKGRSLFKACEKELSQLVEGEVQANSVSLADSNGKKGWTVLEILFKWFARPKVHNNGEIEFCKEPPRPRANDGSFLWRLENEYLPVIDAIRCGSDNQSARKRRRLNNGHTSQ